MAKQPMRVVEEPVVQKKPGRKPDYAVLLRQQPTRDLETGELVRNDNMSVVGAAWKSEKADPQTGELVEYIGIKAHIKFEVGEEGLLLRTWRERDQ